MWPQVQTDIGQKRKQCSEGIMHEEEMLILRMALQVLIERNIPEGDGAKGIGLQLKGAYKSPINSPSLVAVGSDAKADFFGGRSG